jgi:hypothetical protein
MSDVSVVDFPKLRSLIESGSSGTVDARADLHRALAELDWNAQRPMARIPAPAEPEQWITASEAAGIPGVKVEQIYTWAKGQRWASRPSRRCLRINEAGFRRWLTARTGGSR